jgi:hypothetical protein
MKITYVKKAVNNPANALYVIKRHLDLYLGKNIFRNDAGFAHNIHGVITNLKTKKTITNSNNPKAVELNKNGYVALDIPFESSVIEKIVTKYNDLVEDKNESSLRTEFEGVEYSRMVNKIYKKIPEISELVTDEISDIIKQHYKSNFQIHHVLAWRNHHVPSEVIEKKELFASHWHCDGRDTSRITLFVNLSNVTKEHGPLHVQSKERTKELIKNGFGGRHKYNLPTSVVEDPKHVIQNIGPFGTSVLCNPQLCFHRAGIPEATKIRDMLEIRFKPSTEPCPQNWLDLIDEANVDK